MQMKSDNLTHKTLDRMRNSSFFYAIIDFLKSQYDGFTLYADKIEDPFFDSDFISVMAVGKDGDRVGYIISDSSDHASGALHYHYISHAETSFNPAINTVSVYENQYD